MRRKIIMTALLWTTILGCVLCAWSWISGETLQVVVSRVEVTNGIYMYKIDLLGYIRNIQNTLGSIKSLGAIAPSSPTYDWTDALLVFKSLAKVVFYVINWIIYIVQIIIVVPFKFLLYIIVCNLTLLGMNGTAMVRSLNTLYSLNIPYLKYTWLG